MVQHPLIKTLHNLRGNPRYVVLTEPLWGIPYNLYAPYVSVYMLALGLKDSQIGWILTLSLSVQVVSALLSGPITDKVGRRMTTFIFDLISWSVPTLIWAVAQDFRYFIIAALFNGIWRITHTSWSCLLVEDADPDQLMDIYSWIYISGLLVAFFAPIAGLLVNRYSLVPTMRVLYLFACVMMTIKFVTLYIFSTETSQGKVRLAETRHHNLFLLIGSYGAVIKQMMRSKPTLYTLGIMLAMGTATIISNTFWGIYVTQNLQAPESSLSLFSTIRSIIMLVFFFVAMPAIRLMPFRNPMLVGFVLLAVGQVILITLPEKAYLPLVLITMLEACSYAAVSTQMDRMIVVTVDSQERARISGLLFLVVILFTTPFGWIAGKLSDINRILPFLLNMSLYIIGAVLVLLAARRSGQDFGQTEHAAESLTAS